MSGLTPRDEAKRLSTPPLQGRGKGWGVSASRLQELHTRAREMRNNPTEAEVIPPYIADFACPAMKLIVEVDGDTHDVPTDARRDAHLTALGFRVVRVSNADVMTNIAGVLEFILDALSGARSPHPNPSPEGEGRGAVEAQKLLGISLEGSVG